MAKHRAPVEAPKTLWDEIDRRTALGLAEDTRPRHSTGELILPRYAPVSAHSHLGVAKLPLDVWDTNGRTI